jgi:MFS family permease
MSSIAKFVHMLMLPAAGALSDRVGRKPLIITSCALFVVVPAILFGSLAGSNAPTPRSSPLRWSPA